jgi:hypothetical protein
MQHGSHINIPLQIFFSNEPSGKIYARNAVSGPLFTAVNAERRYFRETVDAEINNVIYMELNSGAKMADSKYRKPYVAGSVDRENTVLCQKKNLFCTNMGSML